MQRYLPCRSGIGQANRSMPSMAVGHSARGTQTKTGDSQSKWFSLGQREKWMVAEVEAVKNQVRSAELFP